MSALAEATETRPGDDFDLLALQADAEDNIERLRRDVSRLSLDSLGGDPEVRAELLDCERQLGEAEAEVVRIERARVEAERREMERDQTAFNARQAAALKDARRLQGERAKAAEAVDVAAVAFTDAIVAYVTACRDQQGKLRAAGNVDLAHIARPVGFSIEAAFAHAMREQTFRGALRGLWERMPLIPVGHQRPLAEADAKVVEPLAPTNDRKGK